VIFIQGKNSFVNHDVVKKVRKALECLIKEERWWRTDKFNVFAVEPGAGKSRSAREYAAEFVKENRVKLIYVQYFANDSPNDEVFIKESVDHVNEVAGECLATYITAQNYREEKYLFEKYDIIFITSARYQMMCNGVCDDYIIRNAHTLIVDEFVNISTSYQYTYTDMMLLMGHITNVKEELTQEEIKAGEHLTRHIKAIMEKKIPSGVYVRNLFKQKRRLKYISLIKKLELLSRRNIQINLNSLLVMFDHSSLLVSDGKGGNSLVIVDSNPNYSLAKYNNILLDANGGISDRYTLGSRFFKLYEMPKVFNFKGSFLYHHEVGTTSTALKKYKSVVTDVALHCIRNERHERNTLIVSEKKEFDLIEPSNLSLMNEHGIEVTYHGNLIGKNNWTNFRNIWVCKTPVYDSLSYILEYMFYSGQFELHGNTKLNYVLGEDGYMINQHSGVEKLRTSLITSDYYQSIRRIYRNWSQDGWCTMHVMSNRSDITRMLSTLLSGVNYYNEILPFDLTLKRGRKSRKTQINTTKQLKIFMRLIESEMSMKASKIKKTTVCEKVGIDRKNFSKFINRTPVKNYINEVGIAIGHGTDKQYIILSTS